MNKSDIDIRSAQKKNTLLALTAGVAVIILVAGYLFWLILAKGFAIKVSPDEAVQTKFIAVVGGTGVVIGDSAYSFAGDIVLEVGAKKFITQSVTISPDSPTSIEVVLEPSPGSLMLQTSAGSDDTNWYLDGQLIHIGSNLQQELAPGSYQVDVDDKFHKPSSLLVEIASLEQTTQVIELESIQGVIDINSKPVGANVKVNNQSIGQTPLQISRAGGAYQVELEAEGYELLSDTIEVSNLDSQPARNYILKPKKATLEISATPADGVLLIDGKAANLGTNLITANSSHTVLFEKQGYFPFKQSVKLKPGQVKALAIELEPEYGRVQIVAKPDAQIKINGQVVAQGQYTEQLMAVPSVAEVSKPGYRSVTKNFTPSSKRTSKIDITLMTEFDARRAEGRPLYVDSIGIDMAKFRMTAFSKGSPNNEKWRRRNELQVAVDFTRPVWVSKHEITEAQYRQFEPSAGNTSMPVTGVSWNDAALYCNWLSEQEGLPKFYLEKDGTVIGFDKNSKGYRLPTEAEWEWLARKAKRATVTVYPWGNSERIPRNTGNFGDQSVKGSQTFYLKNYSDNFTGKSPVGSFRADRVGVFDIAGNVSEWVHDYYSTVAPEKKTHINYMGASRGSGHVFKGGSYKSGRLSELRASYRDSSETASDTIGFRIARYD